MTRRYTGGFLSEKEQVTDVNSANGIYTTQEAGALTSTGNFPTGRWTPQRSVRIRDSEPAYLYRTPTVAATSAQKFTFSAWVKRYSPTSTFDSIYAVRMTSSQYFYIAFSSDGTLSCMEVIGTIQAYVVTTRKFRDNAAWYHVVVSVDTTQTVAANRLKIFVNGEQITSFSTATYPALNYSYTYVGSTSYIHSIGWAGNNGVYSGSNIGLSEFYYVDGQQLDCSLFGTTDPETGTWIPKQYTGTYGNQGVYLPFSDNSHTQAIGKNMGVGGNYTAYSETLASWQTLNNVTVTSNSTVAPDGNTTADTVAASSASAGIYIYHGDSVSASTPFTASMYFKAGTVNYVTMSEGAVSGAYASFSLTGAGSVTGSGSGATNPTIVAYPNGWYRCSFTYTTGGSQSTWGYRFEPRATYGGAGAIGDSVIGWGAQLNFGTTIAPYTVTTATLGSGRDFTSSGVLLGTVSNQTYDSSTDVPGIGTVVGTDTGGVTRGNYPVWSTINKGSYITVSQAGTYAYNNSSANYSVVWATHAIPPSGKYYWEFTTSGAGDVFGVGIGPMSKASESDATNANFVNILGRTPGVYSNYSGSAGGYFADGAGDSVGLTTGDVISFAYNADTGDLWLGKNGVYYTLSPSGVHAQTIAGIGSPSRTVDPIWRAEGMVPYMMGYNGTRVGTIGGTANFGQKAFVYTPPAGYKSLCTTNFPTPTIKRPSDHFDVKLWSGNGSSQTIGSTNRQVTTQQIANSLRFRSNATSYLYRNVTVSGSTTKFTQSVWVKRAVLGSYQNIGLCASDGTWSPQFRFQADDTIAAYVFYNGSTWTGNLITSQAFKDTKNWYHFVLAVDTSQAVAADRIKLYVNGTQVSSLSTAAYPPINSSLIYNVPSVGNFPQIGGNNMFDGYMAELYAIDGQQLTPSSFGVFDADNNWMPQRYTGTYGTNGFYLPFTPPSTADTMTYGVQMIAGSGQYLQVSSPGTAFQFGTGDFTIEMFVYHTTSGVQTTYYGDAPSQSNGIYLYRTGTNTLSVYTQSQIVNSTATIPVNQWAHVAVSRSGTTLRIFIDGKLVGSVTDSMNLSATECFIGNDTLPSGQMIGAISNVRVVKGTAVYTAQFTPPTSNLTAISGTSLLTCQGASITDASTNGFTITNTGTVTVVDASPWRRTIGYDASGSGNSFYPYNLNETPSTVVTYGSPGTYTWTAPSGVTSVKALVIAGGGGGADNGGGGGAGGMVYNAAVSVTPGTSYTVTVGSGGRGGDTSSNTSQNGRDSVFSSITAVGGGRGSQQGVNGPGNGGSGGGGSYTNTTGGTGTAGQGNNGGTGNYGNGGNTYYGAGGGGAGGVGLNGGDSRGGPGLANAITGYVKYYAGGGGGNFFITNGITRAVGGIGGGGNSSDSGFGTGAGAPNTGGGGGTRGGGHAGGSGVVILSYTNAYTYTGTGANVIDMQDHLIDSPAEYDASTNGVDIGGVVRGSYAKFNNQTKLYSSLPTLLNGGLFMHSNTDNYQFAITDLALTSGKWYWEYTVQGNGSSGVYHGILDAADIPYLTVNNNIEGTITAAPRGFVLSPGGQGGGDYGVGYAGTTYNPSPGLYWESGDVIQFAFDVDRKLVSIGKNGTWVQSQVPSTGANAFPIIGSGTYYPFAGTYDHPSLGKYGVHANFGQKQFTYNPPTGFKSINTKNLRDVGSYNLPNTWGNTANTPDLVVIKNRTQANRWQWIDTVRGGRNIIFSSDTAAAGTYESIMSFNPNGFTLGTEAGVNGASYPTVGYMWNRGQTPGFDIVTYGGNGTAGTAIPHNLGTSPSMIIIKSLNSTSANWAVYHRKLGTTNSAVMYLNDTGSGPGGSFTGNLWNSQYPTASHFTVGDTAANNASGNSYVAYLWAEVPGFSKFNTWAGNSSTEGPFIHTGFRPKFIMTKRYTSTGNWLVLDTARNPFNNDSDQTILMNTTAAETTGAGGNWGLDISSNGFKIRGLNSEINTSGQSYLFAAFADVPFKYSNAK